jgi:hypothetical protein
MAQNNTSGRNLAAGVGLAALSAAAAGAVFLYGTDAGKKRRKQIKSWSLRMQGDVIDRMEKMKDWSEDAYHKVVNEVSDKYKKVKNVDPIELTAVAADLKRHWKNITKQVQGSKRPARKAPAKKKASPKSKSE